MGICSSLNDKDDKDKKKKDDSNPTGLNTIPKGQPETKSLTVPSKATPPSPFDEQREMVKSATAIQRKFKQLVSNVMAERMCYLRAWHELDKKEERELKEAHSEYLKLKELVGKYDPTRHLHPHHQHDDEKKDVGKKLKTCVNEVKVASAKYAKTGWHHGYQIADVPVLTDEQPITMRFINKMLEQFKQDKILSYENVYQILKRVGPILMKHENVVGVNFGGEQIVTVVGDIHGQLNDLLTIFNMNGFPSEDLIYIFNGDFVDRGQNSAEVVLVMFALKILYPDYVHLNRGNHESKDMNAMDGFETECLDKYDTLVFELFSEVFSCLPLATIVQEKIFVVHAGLAYEDVTIQDLLNFNRFHPIPPDRSTMQALLWSDPRNEPGRHPSERGAGVYFGGDITQYFLEANSLDLIIRSHECVEEGYEMWFDERLITIFSASNYCGDTGNYGAFLTMTPSLEKKIHQYEATANVRKTITTRDESLKKSVISKLIRRITLHRLDLMEYYQKVADKAGKVSRIQWGIGLNTCLGLDQVPFLEFQEPLGIKPPTKPGIRIDYKNFLNKYKASNPELDAIDEKSSSSKPTSKKSEDGSDEKGSLRDSLNQLLFSRRFQLETLFRHFDLNKDGSITLEEFQHGIRALMSVMGKEFQAAEIMKLLQAIDKDGNGEIDYQEFLEAFAPADPYISSQMIPTLNRSSTAGRLDGVAFHTGRAGTKKSSDTTTFHTIPSQTQSPEQTEHESEDHDQTALLKSDERGGSSDKDSKQIPKEKVKPASSEKDKNSKKTTNSKPKSRTASTSTQKEEEEELTPASFASTSPRDSIRKHGS